MQYDPTETEDKIFSLWQSQNAFSPPPHHRIMMPPPNITGRLHIGHALMLSIQDSIVRHRNMVGNSTVYIPGTDHAGIATQAVLERTMQMTADTRVAAAADWRRVCEEAIYGQIRKMGVSCDYEAARFTLDDDYCVAVKRAFIELVERGMVVRSFRMVNWCAKLQSVLSDLEVDGVEMESKRIEVDGGRHEFGKMYYFRYPILKKDVLLARISSNKINKEQLNEYLFGENKLFIDLNGNIGALGKKNIEVDFSDYDYIEIATTRPETILGDTALCVFKPYDDYVAINPITLNCMPIIVDSTADVNIGTGSLKVTPSSDSADYELMKKYGLKMYSIIDNNNYIDSGIGIDVVEFNAIENIEKFNKINQRVETVEKQNDQDKIIMNENFNKINQRVEKQNDQDKIIMNENFNKINQRVEKQNDQDKIIMNEKFKRFNYRLEVIKYLKKINIFIKSESHKSTIPICSRTGDVVEPLLKMQWWVNCKDMARMAMDSEIEFYPPEAKKRWMGWLEGIKDWCISRQLWWGHRIPAYRVVLEEEYKINDLGVKVNLDKNGVYKNEELLATLINTDDGLWIVADDYETATKMGELTVKTNFSLVQDVDVLDTWFSSGLWPMALQGWPKNKDWEPTELLETGVDILFFWVARMAMLSIFLCNRIPFKKVLLHGIVRDRENRKMSKSLGNVIDPMDIINGATLDELLERINTSKKEKCNEQLDEIKIEADKIGNKESLGDIICSDELKVDSIGNKERFKDINYSERELINEEKEGLADIVDGMVSIVSDSKGTNEENVRSKKNKKKTDSVGKSLDRLSIQKKKSVKEDVSKSTKLMIETTKKWYPNGIKRSGADALRFTLLNNVSGMKDVCLDLKRVEGYRKFCNKIWNAFLYLERKIESLKNTENIKNCDVQTVCSIKLPFNQNAVSKYFYVHRNQTISAVNHAMENYDFHTATSKIYSFFYLICDTLIEIDKGTVGNTELLRRLFLDCITILHPFLPFVTEHVYQNMGGNGLLMQQKYPIEKCVVCGCKEKLPVEFDRKKINELKCGHTEEMVFNSVYLLAVHLRSELKNNTILRVKEFGEEIKSLVKKIKIVETGFKMDEEIKIYEGIEYQLSEFESL